MSSMQERIDQFDWSATPIGARETWPQSLRTSLSICLASRFPILIWWGPELIKLYNDAYSVILGDKDRHALGARGRDVWPEIWHVIGPMLDQVRLEGKATWSDDQLLIMDRRGYSEETYFTFSYSPIRDESGGIGGVFTAVTETTARVLGERRLDTLRQLAARASEGRSVREACRNAAEILEGNPHDIPFAAIYLREGDVCSHVVTAGDAPTPAPATYDCHSADRIWPDLALTLPLHRPGESEPAGFLVAGVSPRRALDEEYRAFFSLVAGHIASAIADARAYELERQRAEALAELDRAKTAFFSNVSHEFRTPLTLMLGQIEDVLGSKEAVSESTREQLQVAHRNALRLLKLVNNLLDFSRIEAGRVEAVFEPTDLTAVTTELASVFRSAVERTGLRYVIDCEPLGEPVFVDREMWEKLLFNLLSNALKFTFEGEIEVALRRAGDVAELSVRDTGTGIPAGELPHVFERFRRVRNARGRTYEGSGIGLALVEELARLHGGTVRAVSEVDRGSTFTVSIPFGTAHLSPDRIGANRALVSTALRAEAYVEEALRWLPSAAASETATRPAAGRATTIADRPAFVLLADDNADMREYVQRLLGTAYEVEAVGDGTTALETARRRPPDLVLADVMMPGLDGFELLRALREDERTREIPVILLSARAGEESRVEGLESGADDYLTKPFSARELLARVGAHLRLQHVRRETQAALRASEAKFSTAFDRSPLALVITDLDDGRIIEVNEGFVRLSGYSREEVLGRRPGELGLWIDPDQGEERFRRMRAGEAVPDVEARFRVRNGEELIGVIGSAVVEIGGRACVLSSVTDITERKRAEDAVRESEALIREFADTAPAMLWITDPDADCTFVSRGWYEFTGQRDGEPLGTGWTEAIHPDDRASAQETFFGANVRREPFAMDLRVRHVDGGYRWVIVSGRPRISSGGHYLGFVGSVFDITDRKLAEQAKDEFLATLSHELRTPLTSGFGWVKLLGRAREPELLETGLRAIEESFVNQMKLVDDLLDISRIAAGKLYLDMHPVDLGSVVDAAVEMVRPAALAKGIALTVRTQAVLTVRGDAPRLKQVFWNLIANAVKFTHRGGAVSVELRRRRGSAEIVVRDDGEGIDTRFLPHVFDRFRQADASTTRKHGGLGIGLAIVASLVEAHGGTVRAHSGGAGKGSTFAVTIPLLEHGAAIQSPAIADADGAGSKLAGARILVVDDDAGARKVMIATLQAAGAEVLECSSVVEAYDAVRDWRPDLLISDLAMPHEDGYSLIRRIRDTGSLLPALAITAYVRPEDEVRVREAGFQRHVAKPFDPEDLVRAVRELTEA